MTSAEEGQHPSNEPEEWQDTHPLSPLRWQTWEKWCLVPQAQFPGFWGFLKMSGRFYKNACKVAQLGRKTFSSNMIWVWHSSTQAYYLILDYLIETTSFWLPYYGSFIEVLSLRLPHWVTKAARQGGLIKFAFHHWGILIEAALCRFLHWGALFEANFLIRAAFLRFSHYDCLIEVGSLRLLVEAAILRL